MPDDVTTGELLPRRDARTTGGPLVPALIADAGNGAARRFLGRSSDLRTSACTGRALPFGPGSSRLRSRSGPRSGTASPRPPP